MADSEKHSIRNRIIFPVVSGLILAGLIYFIPKVFAFVQNAISTTWNYLLSKTLLPNFLLCLLIILAIPTIFGFAKLFFRPKLQQTSDEISINMYKSDVLFGLSWKWSFINTNDLPSQDLWCFCPSCTTRLVYKLGYGGEGTFITNFLCENCGFKSKQFVGNRDDALGTVIREIERRIATEEWKDSVKESGSKVNQD